MVRTINHQSHHGGVPLGGACRPRAVLRLPAGAGTLLTMVADDGDEDGYQAGNLTETPCRVSPDHRVSGVERTGDVVSVTMTRGPIIDDFLLPPQPVAIRLAREPEWRIEIAGGACKLWADLSGLRLEAFILAGGVSGLDLTLGHPAGRVPVTITQGVTDLVLRRPRGVAVSVDVTGGAANARLDNEVRRAVGDRFRWATSDDELAADGYDIAIGGGAVRLALTTAA